MKVLLLIIFSINLLAVERSCFVYTAGSASEYRYSNKQNNPYRCNNDRPIFTLTDDNWQYNRGQYSSEALLIKYDIGSILEFQQSEDYRDVSQSIPGFDQIYELNILANELWNEMRECIEHKYSDELSSISIDNRSSYSWFDINRIDEERKREFVIPQVIRRVIFNKDKFCSDRSKDSQLWQKYELFKSNSQNLIGTLDGARVATANSIIPEFHPLYIQEIFDRLLKDFYFNDEINSREAIRDMNTSLSQMDIRTLRSLSEHWWQEYRRLNFRDYDFSQCEGQQCALRVQGSDPTTIARQNSLFLLEMIPLKHCFALGLWPNTNQAIIGALAGLGSLPVELDYNYTHLFGYFTLLNERIEQKCGKAPYSLTRKVADKIKPKRLRSL